ncbi:right-handed parallel beta-helix repeat-containing protein [Corallococcus sp. bb12-1]|uniref:right-handed parallel beta-helix repeat-containing protein n=1 Tax=Corallococcus sp. bb12-1 TaxID=2996784 RepID=UPI002270FAB4|nr:right-handed parallel beta-helix repeat-containing protein [Corallococcus sp. bb12-1]MCY1046159.1 right-handed parallel beta-helix repeat-containing protein [Corallococcus sp. bb12-1]
MSQVRDWVGAVALASVFMEGGAAQAEGNAVQCGDTLTQHTRLTRDLVCPGTEAPALRVVGEGIVLDLGGHTVRRSGPAMGDSQGIVVEANGTVRNGTIRGFRWGYVLDSGADNVRLHELSLVDNGTAIYHRGGYARFLITNSSLRGNTTGMSSAFDEATGEFNIRSSFFTGNGRVMFVDAHDVDVVESTFNSNENVIECFNGNIRIRSSTLAMNTAVGSLAFDPAGGFDFCAELRFEDTMIANNTALAPPEAPVWGPFRFVMRNSWVVNNGSGLHAGSRTVYLEGNTFWDNAGGLTLADLPETVPYPLTGIVRGNHFLRNASDGFRVLAPSTPTVVGNTAMNNVGWGIHAPTAYDAGGNVARGNGAGNCEGVACSAF